MRGVFVTGTDTEVGKSVVAASICAALAARGERVAAFKPVVTGLDEEPGEFGRDHELLAAAANAGQLASDVTPHVFGPAVSPHLAAELAGVTIEPANLLAAARAHELVVCEGVGGLLVPITPGYLVRDLAVDLALPVVIVAFLFVVAVGTSTSTLVIVIGLVFGLLIARTVRTAVLQERELDYIAAARLRDENHVHIMFVEILPNVFGPILVEFTVRLGYAIFTVAVLSFLGFGIQPPTPDWGADIANSYQYLGAGYWWEVLFAALAVASLVIAINLIADSIEAVLIR